MESQTMQLQLSLEEINIILNSLGKRPFEEVYGIIHKIHQQANQQLGQPDNPIFPENPPES